MAVPAMVAIAAAATVAFLSRTAAPQPTYITTNLLYSLPPLPKVHNMWEGIDHSYLSPPPVRNTTKRASLELMVEFARIMGSFPVMLDADGTYDTVVEICINASRRHPTARLPYLTFSGSPWVDVHGEAAALNRTLEQAEVARWRAVFTQTQVRLAESNKQLGATVQIGWVQFDIESWSWSPDYIGRPGDGPGTQALIDAVGRKSELVFNITKQL